MTTAAVPMPRAIRRLPSGERLLDIAIIAMAVASTCVIVGLIWDISWHRTIGRDTFWTPAHLAIYLGGTISGLVCTALVMAATFGHDEQLKATSVRFWGFYAPVGVWVAIWGAIAMLTSAPFDNWWHNAYGLDVKVLSPPHVLLGLGMMFIQLGSLLLAASRTNAGIVATGWRHWLPYWIGGVWLAMLLQMVFEYSISNNQHSSMFYIAMACTAPIALAAAARGLGGRWPATTVALVYMVVILAMLWILPRFAATPRLGPIYNPMTHMSPPPFPLWLVVPAAAFDLIYRNDQGKHFWRKALVAGIAFVVLLLLVQWPFSIFLIHSTFARGWVFAADIWGYSNRLGPWRYQFWNVPTTPAGAIKWLPLVRGLLGAMVAAIITTAMGAGFGNWLARVRR
ncbi:MAG TPA: hypothetical protein VHW65_06320 [Gemmatimonadales bacterium]|jgi:hypothetical protein|nr:hypothetical protein [Gemmatimonadales bacterium]